MITTARRTRSSWAIDPQPPVNDENLGGGGDSRDDDDDDDIKMGG